MRSEWREVGDSHGVMSAATSDAGVEPDRVRAEQGVEGNSRLTSAIGLLLIGLLAVEGYTILDVQGLITLHIFLGTLLVGPVLLKVATTSYRFVRYYTGSPAYVRKGPPPIVLRVLGPLVTLSSLAVLGTGLGLLTVHSRGGALLTAHQASFIVWVSVMTIHVLGHVREAAVSTWRDLRQASSRRRLRFAAVVAALVIGVGGAVVVLPSATQWTNRSHDAQFHHDRRP
jgi:hypothetical protein